MDLKMILYSVLADTWPLILLVQHYPLWFAAFLFKVKKWHAGWLPHLELDWKQWRHILCTLLSCSMLLPGGLASLCLLFLFRDPLQSAFRHCGGCVVAAVCPVRLALGSPCWCHFSLIEHVQSLATRKWKKPLRSTVQVANLRACSYSSGNDHYWIQLEAKPKAPVSSTPLIPACWLK